MLEISAFKSFTGHVFDTKEDCVAWETRVRQMQAEVTDNLRNDLLANDIDSFPKDLLDVINNFNEDDCLVYLTALSKISYWFNNSGLNYDMNFICYAGEECTKTKDWLSKRQSNKFK